MSWYSGNIRDSVCKGSVDIGQFVRAVREPSEPVKELITAIHTATVEGDMETKAKLKEQLYCFTPCSYVLPGNKRIYENINRFTGLVHLDFDKIDNALELKDYLWDNHPELVCAFLSPSGKGVKALMRIPRVTSVDEYKEHFLHIEEMFTDLGLDCFDHAPYNAILPLFLSWDPKVRYRKDATIYTGKKALSDVSSYENLAITKPQFYVPDGETFGTQGYYKKITIDIFTRKIDEITGEPGHNRMRDACLVLGSRSAAGYMTRSEAESLAQFCIQANPYLARKGKAGLQNYIKTSLWAINRGQFSPKYYR